MLSLLVITYLMVAAAGTAVLVHGIVFGPIGFEDATGYHEICGHDEWELAVAMCEAARVEAPCLR